MKYGAKLIYTRVSRALGLLCSGCSHHDHAVTARILADHAEEVVRRVARDVVERADGAVAPDDGRARERNGLLGGLVRDVRDVDQHAEAVHLDDERAAERAEQTMLAGATRGTLGAGTPQAAVHGLDLLEDAGAVREGVVARVRERHVAGAERVELAEDAERVADLVRALDADQARDAAGGDGELRLGAAGHEGEGLVGG
jgi:hypothetical protein